MGDLNIVEKWKGIGLLEGLDDNKSKLIANAFEIADDYINNLKKYSGPNDLPNGYAHILPILRYILSKINVDESNLKDIILDIYGEYLRKSYNIMLDIMRITPNFQDNIDLCAETVYMFSNNYIKEYNEKTTK